MNARMIGAAITLALSVATGAQTPQPPATAHPAVRVIALPDFWGEYAIWGAAGADARGRIYLGITSNDNGSGSAHLFRYDPDTGVVSDRGAVLDQLARLGLLRPGEKQMKIHSRIVQMPDGYLYFSSMDENGEADDGSKLPTWGGHLWRLGPSGAWEHLARTQEALIAVAAGGQYVYALGYFNNVLYQYDTKTGKIASQTIGTFGGHVTRNFFADDRGHAYVPRVTHTSGAANDYSATLIELDPGLREVGSHLLEHYLDRSPDESHGIVATHPDGAGGWYFATSKGRLYHEERSTAGPSAVTDMGWYHPAGPHYVASMFRDPATGALYGASCVGPNGCDAFEWVTRGVDGRATVSPLPYGDGPFPHSAVLYGSMTRDAQGRVYVVGSMKYKPVVLQITP
jgi:hypothetical protein